MRDKLIGLLSQHGFERVSLEDFERQIHQQIVFVDGVSGRSSQVSSGFPDGYYELAYEFLLQWPIFRMRSVTIKPSPIMPNTAKVKVTFLYRGMILTTGINLTHEVMEAQKKNDCPDLIWRFVMAFFDGKMEDTRELTPTMRHFPDEAWRKNDNPFMRPEVQLGEADDQ